MNATRIKSRAYILNQDIAQHFVPCTSKAPACRQIGRTVAVWCCVTVRLSVTVTRARRAVRKYECTCNKFMLEHVLVANQHKGKDETMYHI